MTIDPGLLLTNLRAAGVLLALLFGAALWRVR
jgi:hypothetical protein